MLYSYFRSVLLWSTACLMCLREGEREQRGTRKADPPPPLFYFFPGRESTLGAEVKIEKNIQLHYPRPPSIKK